MSRVAYFWVAITLLLAQFAVAIPAQKHNERLSHLDSRSPQGLGGALGGTLGGVGSLLGGAVGGLGSLLGNTVGGLGTAVGALVGYKPGTGPAPQQPPREQEPGRVSSLKVTTRGDQVLCRKYPDLISPNMTQISVFKERTALEVTCWTFPSIRGAINGDNNWLKTKQGCFINEVDLNDGEEIQTRLNPCPRTPRHWVGTLQAQYEREDCYLCASLDCPSNNLGAPPLVDLGCSMQGEEVNGNSTWVRAKDQNCFFPGSVFNNYGWLGTPGGNC